jgi:hypothetical protein
VGLTEALNPLVLVNYASLAAVVPGAFTIGLASYLRAQARRLVHRSNYSDHQPKV